MTNMLPLARLFHSVQDQEDLSSTSVFMLTHVIFIALTSNNANYSKLKLSVFKLARKA